MSNINLRYISAESLTESLANCKTISEVGEVLELYVESDIHRAKSYIEKYDNKWDRLETNVEDLKDEVERIEKMIGLLKNNG